MTTHTLLDTQRGQVASEGLLGRLLWYSVPVSTRLDPQAVAVRLKELGFTRRIPTTPSESNLFRRVTAKDQERRNLPVVGHDDQFENVLIRPVNGRSDNVLVRRIVVERVDPNGRRIKSDDGLDFIQVVDIEFEWDTTVSPNKGVLSVHWINGWNATTHPQAAELVDHIKSEFQNWKGMFHDAIMRHWIKQTILDMGAVAVRPTGGIYFLEEKYAHRLEALEMFIDEMMPPEADCHSLEIPDNRKQRAMVKRAIEAETLGAIETMMAKISQIRQDGKLTPKLYLQMTAEVSAMEKKMASYSSLLEADLHAVETRTQILRGMVSGLSGLQRKSTRGRGTSANNDTETSEGRDEDSVESGSDAGTEGADSAV